MSGLIASFIAVGLTVGLVPLASADPAADRAVSVDVATDRARADGAAAAVEMDARQVDVATQRVWQLKVAWDRAVRDGHPDAAGYYAKAHWAALVDLRRAEDAMRYARANLEAIRERLDGEEQDLQRG